MLPFQGSHHTVSERYRSDVIPTFSLNEARTYLLRKHLLTTVRRVPPATHIRAPPTLTFSSGSLKSFTVRARLREKHIDLFECAARGLGAIVPDVCGSEETADQRPDEDFRSHSCDASATAEDHHPGRKPFTCCTETAGDVAVSQRGNLWAFSDS